MASTQPSDSIPRSTADLELVRAFLSRRPNGTEPLVARLATVASVLRALNTRMGRPLDEHDLSDVVQDVTAIALRKLEHFDGRTTLDGWIYGIANFELRNAVRRAARRPRAVEDVAPDLEPTTAPDDEPESDGLSDELRRGLDQLSPTERDVIAHKHLDGLTFEAIGARLCLSVNTVKSRYYRGMVKLQRTMEPHREVFGR